jgi:hypothetical protein
LAIAPTVAPVKKGALVTITAHLELKAPPARVWATAASAKGFSALTGFEPDAADRARTFSKIGASIGASAWTDKGRLFVTGLVPGKELRITWEPENASYLCAKRIVLAPSPGGTSLEYWDRYTDDQPSVDETAKQVRGETLKHLEDFRALVEK